MRFPTDNFLTDWNLTAGNGFGDVTSYGYHEANDLNLNGGGNIDLGQPLFAVADGEITSVHTHIGSPTFGKHLHLKFNIDGKDYFAHYAHCDTILVTEGTRVKKGDKIATCGNSGTTFAHLHFAIKNQPTGIDGLAKTQEDLAKWENPIEFIKKHFVEEKMVTMTLAEADAIRLRRDELYNLSLEQAKNIEQLTKDVNSCETQAGQYLDQLTKLNEEDKSTSEQLLDAQKALQPLKDTISATKKALGYDDTLLDEKLPELIKELREAKVKYIKKPTGFLEKLVFLFRGGE